MHALQPVAIVLQCSVKILTYEDKPTNLDHFDSLDVLKCSPALQSFPSSQIRLFWYSYYHEA
ncbi:hypothetical protein HCUR_00154 [Holospora curviuscula]|uniref:Uncharacterized protein n=1 Tax=Holospora curviuscula TaxID=1082868 RepID=A0A2S5R8A9_9PROT|nr:hypothetical protein HCUR_00993 [Holospora curviuscula]PPE05708.1 hypothetical protein HCUR_00154 [Holospora curviuscula]